MITFPNKIDEKNSAVFRFKLYDDDAVTAIPAASITSASLSLRDRVAGTAINGRTAVDVLAQFASDGSFTFVLAPLDNIIVSTSAPAEEEHVLSLKIVANGAAGALTRDVEFLITVKNLQFVS